MNLEQQVCAQTNKRVCMTVEYGVNLRFAHNLRVVLINKIRILLYKQSDSCP